MDIFKNKVGNTTIKYYSETKELLQSSAITNSWKNSFNTDAVSADGKHLRDAQKGALYAIKAHWTVSNKPATVVMPTGTGKTETMMATVISERIEKTLIIVPSKLLRKQTADKFITLGVLPEIGVLPDGLIFPNVTEITSTPENADCFEKILQNSNIIVITMTLLSRFSDELFSLVSQYINAVIIDEAHHISAEVWSETKYKLRNIKCIQFTATPYRNDGKKVDGKIIFNYPLSLAQKEGFFKGINFVPISEFDEENGDYEIAKKAIEVLNKDIEQGYNHCILVRAKSIKSATYLYENVYFRWFKEYNPVLITSQTSKNEIKRQMKSLKEGSSKIVVCVDMFGEGIDIPNLKIAAIHDKYKSLPITLQFIGRFARDGKDLGDATIITNIANDDLSDSIKDLYAQDSDWNKMLNILSDSAIGKELELQELAQRFDHPSISGIAIEQIKPKISMVAYTTPDSSWHPRKLWNSFNRDSCIISINEEEKIIVIIEKSDYALDWSNSKELYNTFWNLHLVYWNPDTHYFFINSTNKSISDEIAELLYSESKRIQGEIVFRCLSDINRLMLGTVGLRSAINGPIRYRMFAGVDIKDGVAEATKARSTKSNLFGVGYNGRGRVSIGCSYKGKIWSKWIEDINYWKRWCDEIAEKLSDNNIDTDDILSGVLVPEVINCRPTLVAYGIEWPMDLEILTDSNVCIIYRGKEYELYYTDLKIVNQSTVSPIQFSVSSDAFEGMFELNINEKGFGFNPLDDVSKNLSIRYHRNTLPLQEFFDNHYQPLIKFVDGSNLEGNLYLKLNNTPVLISQDQLHSLDWSNTDITQESQKKERRADSIQYKIIEELKTQKKYSIIFDDDGKGEIADIVAIEEAEQKIIVSLFHCKFSESKTPGKRISDLYEVCGQAEKSIKWCQDPMGLIPRIVEREKAANTKSYSRFQVGGYRKLKEIYNKMKVYQTEFNISIVQPGIMKNDLSEDSIQLLSVTSSFLRDTYGINLTILCS